MPVTYWSHNPFPDTGRTYHIDEFVGRVLSLGEKEMTDLDGWYRGTQSLAFVWDGTKIVSIPYAHSGDPEEFRGYATVDATDEVRQEYLFALWTNVYTLQKNHLTEVLLRHANTLERGKVGVVKRGRKVPHGTTGKIIGFTQPKSYGYNTKPVTKVGLATTDRVEPVTIGRKTFDKHLDVVWVDSANVDVVQPAGADIEKDNEKELTRQAEAKASEAIAWVETGLEKRTSFAPPAVDGYRFVNNI